MIRAHADEEFRQEIRDFLKAELPQGWNNALVLGKKSDEYITLAKSLTHRVSAKGRWQHTGPRSMVT